MSAPASIRLRTPIRVCSMCASLMMQPSAMSERSISLVMIVVAGRYRAWVKIGAVSS